jgi:outer membrane protein
MTFLKTFRDSASRYFYLLVVSGLLHALFLPSLQVQAAGLLEVYQQARQNDPSFQSAGYRKLAVEEGRNQSLAELLPAFGALADYSKTYQDVRSTENDVYELGTTSYDTTTFGLTLTQAVFHWDSIVAFSQAKAKNKWAAARYVLAQHELIIRVVDLYLQALAAQDQLDFARAEQSAVNKHFELASGRFDMGLIPITDLHDAKARKAAIQARTIEAQNLFDDALQALSEVTGEPVDFIQPLMADINLVSPDPRDPDSWITKALEYNPAIKLQEHAVEVARLEVDKQKAGHYPTIDLVGSYNRRNTGGSLYGGGSDVDVSDVVVTLNVPFYEGGAVSSRVREASHLLSISHQELVKQRRAVERQTRSAYLGVNSALTMIEALDESVTANKLSLEGKQDGFKSGLYTTMNVLDAERDLSLVSIDYARARYKYILSNLKLKQAVGILSPEDVVELDSWFTR